MLTLFLKMGIDTAWYVTSGVWYLGKRLAYGKDVDPAEKALQEINRISEKVELEMKELKEIRDELKAVREHNDWIRSLPAPLTHSSTPSSPSTTNDASIDTEHSIESDNNQHNKDLNTHTHLKACPLDVEQPVVVEEGSTVPSVTDC